MAPKHHQATLLSFEIKGSWFAVPLSMVEGVAPLHEIVSIPKNTSRVLLGLTYTLGQLMAAVDIAPLVNLGKTGDVSDALVLLFNNEYYAIKISQVGSIISRPKLKRTRETYHGLVISGLEQGKREIKIISVPELVNKHTLCN